ncbi:TrmB family transcriptional regulator [Halomontanus rarus]|uniref:TrmB family transcriptional regulator n=1 Tax=Halomontanus rarus TaxID=3034020 RepID=UPI00293B8FE7|nr:TrmB family transcriptional regulator sugar-binding domain-containing protein [Halovivax sp. KZCA124]
MTDQELTKILQSFGFTSKEIDTYITILKMGETTVSTVAEEAGVSKRHVYNTAVQLEERNFVEINDFMTPTKLRPVPSDRVKERLNSEMDTLHSLISDLSNPSGEEFKTLELLKSKVTLIKRIQQLIDEADDQITIAVPSALIFDLQDQLSAAVERDVFVLLIAYGRHPSQIDNLDLNGIAHAVRFRWDEIPIQLSVDGNFGLVAPKELLTNPGEQTKAVAFGQSYLEPIVIGSFLSNEWQFSESMCVKIPEELPQTYTNFRLATMQATIYESREDNLYARIEARPIGHSGPTEQLSGEVIDIRQRIIEPMRGSVLESALDLRTDDHVVSIGGGQAFLEDYEAVTTYLTTDETEIQT